MCYAELGVFDINNFDFKYKIFSPAYVISTYIMFYFLQKALTTYVIINAI
jgi:hypothetical protein